MRKEEIFLDLSKYGKTEIIEIAHILEQNNEPVYSTTLKSLRKGNLDGYTGIKFSQNEWLRGDNFFNRKEINLEQFKDLFKNKNESNSTIPTDLKVGQEIEVNGFILKVDREVEKWYKVSDVNLKVIYFRKFKKDQDVIFLKNNQNFNIIEITDQEFINQLEKHS